MDAITKDPYGVTLNLREIHLERQRGNLRGEWVVEAVYTDAGKKSQGIVATYHSSLKKAIRYIRDGAKHLIGWV